MAQEIHDYACTVAALDAEIARLKDAFHAQVLRNLAIADAMEDVTLCLEEDHGDTKGAGCCFSGECEWARSIRVARELLDVEARRVSHHHEEKETSNG